MQNENLTFNDLPQVVAQLRDEVMDMRAMLTSFYKLLSEQNGQEPMTMEVFKERKSIIRAISQNMAKKRPARNMVKLMYLYVEFEIGDDEFENDFGRLRDEWATTGDEMPVWLQNFPPSESPVFIGVLENCLSRSGENYCGIRVFDVPLHRETNEIGNR